MTSEMKVQSPSLVKWSGQAAAEDTEEEEVSKASQVRWRREDLEIGSGQAMGSMPCSG